MLPSPRGAILLTDKVDYFVLSGWHIDSPEASSYSGPPCI